MYQRILVPVDGSPTSTRGLKEAIKLARLTGARLRLIHVVDELALASGLEGATMMTGEMVQLLRDSGERVLARARASAEKAGVAADSVLGDSLAGRICDQVVDQARKWRADLIVIGTHGRRGLGRMLLGSDAEMIVRLANVPVLLVRAKPAPGAS